MKRLGPSVAGVLLGQTALLLALGWTNRYQVNPDAVAYLRIASYCVSGQTELMVSGYWGPMLSWLVAPLLPLVSEPLLAARIVMGVSAIVFTLGALAIFLALELPRGLVLLGTAVVALLGASFSVHGITPDLLVGGLIGLAASRLLSRRWPEQRRTQWAAGALFGLAYYAKAVALPVGGILAVLVAGTWWACRQRGLRTLAPCVARTLAAMVITASPWIVMLSIKYERLVFSTTARIARTVPGPRDVVREHPFGLMFAAPPEGRLTWWEDPSGMPYRHWSPLENWTYFEHQIDIITTNVGVIAGHLGTFDWLRLGVFSVAIGLLLHAPWRRNLLDERWRWSGVAVLGLGAVYLPVYALGLRYYYTAVPFLLAAALGLVVALTTPRGDEPGGVRPVVRRLGLLVAALSFAMPSFIEIPAQLQAGAPQPSSRILAGRLRDASIDGPIAGDTMEGLLTAFFAGQPFHGGYPAAQPGDYLASGARVLVTVRSFPIAATLDTAAGFENLDAVLFDSPESAAAFPLKAYRIDPAGATRAGGDGEDAGPGAQG